MSVYIISNPGDAHAIAVEWALQEIGAQVTNWHWADYPGLDRLSAELSGSDSRISLIRDAGPRTVWVHRGLRPVPSAATHPADADFIRREASEMLQGLLWALTDDAFCVNPTAASQRWRSKQAQLKLAARCGLDTPHTLMSNDPERIREFERSCRTGMIMKPFTPALWRGGEATFAPYTATIAADQLQNDLQLSLCPAIYQEKLDKLYELRIVVMGHTIWTARIDSQRDGESIDWRGDYNGYPPVEPHQLSPQEERLIRDFMAQTGLIYGSIDVVVTRDGRFVFLEINEMGQFLWIEQLDPGYPLLDCFVRLLLSRRADFHYDGGQQVLRFADAMAHVTPESLAARVEQHVQPSDWLTSNEAVPG